MLLDVCVCLCVFERVCVCLHLVFDHGTEVVVPEEHRDLSLFSRRVEFTQTMIRQLSRCRLQKLLCYQALGTHTYAHTHTQEVVVH